MSRPLRGRQVSSTELTSMALERIEASQPMLNAFRCVRTEAALSEAAEADRRLAAGERLPLLGLPVAIKDDVDLAGEATAFGCSGAFEPKAADAHGRHKKQSGGHGQFADCKITIEPLPRGSDFEFVDEIFGGSIPRQYIPAVEKGIQDARRKGFLAGYPVVDFRVRLLDGQYHDVDSSEMAFKIAGSLAFQQGMEQARPTLLEPIMRVDISAPTEYVGDLMGDLNSRRGRMEGVEADEDVQTLHARVPLAEMLTYGSTLRSITQGRGSFHMEYSHYEEVPRSLQEKIIAESKKAHTEQHAAH